MFTILGHTGFVGRRLATALLSAGEDVFTPKRDLSDIDTRPLGHLIDCTGNDKVTADPFGVVDAHIGVLRRALAAGNFDSYLYLSTTRIYQSCESTGEETDIVVSRDDPQRLFIYSKLAGEALCLNNQRATIRVARLSNVYGVNPHSHNFLPTLIRNALTTGRITLSLDPSSAKDYVAVDDVVAALPEIARRGRHRLYNVASGVNTTAGEIVDRITAHTRAQALWQPGAPKIVSAAIDVTRLSSELPVRHGSILSDLPDLVEMTKRELGIR